jgi:hypothetical protein
MKLYVLDWDHSGSFSVMALSRQEAWKAIVKSCPYLEEEYSMEDLQVGELDEVIVCMGDQ